MKCNSIYLQIAFFVISVLQIAGSGEADARRVALVVGNSSYTHATPLPNPRNDAAAISGKLEELGFEVVQGIDLDRAQTLGTLSEFAGRLVGAEAALFFYAGHGIQVSGTNYIVPIDAKLEREADVFLSLVSLDDILRVMETEVPTRLVLLDACRDNPLARSLKRSMGVSRSTSVGQGLARVDTAVGTLIAYATAPGDVAEDGSGTNSPFTTSLLKHMDTPGIEVRQVLSRVRQGVFEETDGRQVPWDSSSLMGDFYFTLNIEVNVQKPEVRSEPAPDTGRNGELVYWETIRDSSEVSDFEGYMRRFGEAGLFYELAQSRVRKLEQSANISPVEDPTPEPPAAPVEASLQPAEQTEPELSRSEWRDLQRALEALNFNPGGTDGRPGPRTRAAIRDWQAKNGFAVTGKLAAAEIASLSKAVPKAPAGRATSVGLAFEDCEGCPEMIVMPKGSFHMGADPGAPGFEADEAPRHLVTIKTAFALGKYEVSRGEYRKFVEATGHQSQKGCIIWQVLGFWMQDDETWNDNPYFANDSYPISCISVTDAEAYLGWLRNITGKSYRLPSESEWEFAGRGGSDAPYYWGNEEGEACSYANLYDNAGREVMPVTVWSNLDCNDGAGFGAPRGKYKPNAYGLYDMVGNVTEYMADCWHGDYQGHPADGSPWVNSGDCTHSVIRGNVYWGHPSGNQIYDRYFAARADGGLAGYGFRVALSLE